MGAVRLRRRTLRSGERKRELRISLLRSGRKRGKGKLETRRQKLELQTRNLKLEIRKQKARLDLALDANDLARLNGFDAREAGGHEGQEVFETVGLRLKNDNCQLSRT